MASLCRSTASRMLRGALVSAALVIALTVGSVGAFATPPGVRVRVEGANHTVFSGLATAQPVVMTDSDGAPHTFDGNAMWALGSAAQIGSFPYVLKDSAFGLFIDSVAGEQPVPTPPYPGWLYRVNGISPMVGADQYTVVEGDEVLWYYGTYDASPTVAVVPVSPAVEGAVITVTAQQLDPSGVPSPLPGATVHLGSVSAVADAQGEATFVAGTVGDYSVVVECAGYIRSAAKTVRVRRAGDADVWRFFNKKTGTHFYTASDAEKSDVIARLSAVYRLDGLAYTVNEASADNDTALHRFFNKKTGTHFYTADPAEKAKVESTMASTYRLDGPAYYLAP